jgi:hypothetical protein
VWFVTFRIVVDIVIMMVTATVMVTAMAVLVSIRFRCRRAAL